MSKCETVVSNELKIGTKVSTINYTMCKVAVRNSLHSVTKK